MRPRRVRRGSGLRGAAPRHGGQSHRRPLLRHQQGPRYGRIYSQFRYTSMHTTDLHIAG